MVHLCQSFVSLVSDHLETLKQLVNGNGMQSLVSMSVYRVSPIFPNHIICGRSHMPKRVTAIFLSMAKGQMSGLMIPGTSQFIINRKQP